MGIEETARLIVFLANERVPAEGCGRFEAQGKRVASGWRRELFTSRTPRSYPLVGFRDDVRWLLGVKSRRPFREFENRK